MAVEQKILRLLECLKDATSKGRLFWEQASFETVVKLSLGDGVVWLEEDVDEADGAVWTSYHLWIDNREGRVVRFESFDDQDSPEYSLAGSLYRAIRSRFVRKSTSGANDLRKSPIGVDDLLDRLIADVSMTKA